MMDDGAWIKFKRPVIFALSLPLAGRSIRRARPATIGCVQLTRSEAAPATL